MTIRWKWPAICGLACALLCGCVTTVSDPAQGLDEASTALDAPCPPLSRMLEFSNGPVGQKYRESFQNQIYYPKESLDAKQGGKVLVCVLFNRDGSLQKAKVMVSSGYPLLDGAALYSVGLTQLVPHGEMELPDGQRQAWIALSVSFDPTPGEEYRHPPAGPCAEAAESKAYPGDKVMDRSALDSDEMRAFIKDLSVAIQEQMIYPSAAQKSEHEGTTEVCFSYDRSSEIVDAAILESSGSPLLDGAALMGVAAGLQLKRNHPQLPPKALRNDASTFQFSVPVQWVLENN